MVPTLFGMSLAIFLMVRLMPGDVIDVLTGGDVSITPAQREGIRRTLGLDKPLPVQYLQWVGGMATGNPGLSLRSQEPVGAILARALPITVELVIIAVVFAVALGIPLGVISASRRESVGDYVARVGGLIGLSMPSFWLATLILLFTSIVFQWIPAVSFVPFLQDRLGNLSQVVIPGISVSVFVIAIVMRMTRATMLEVLSQDYVRTARAKGASRRSVTYHHALRNALIPVVTVVGFQVGTLMSGAAIVEVIFGLPGLGYTLIQAIFARDYPLVQTTTMLLATIFVILNLTVDLLYGVIDPRIRAG
jgi:peptide/nickel transport system permease protein